MQAPLESFVPHLLLGSPAQTWPELASQYLKSIADRLEIEPSTRTLAEQTTVAATTDDQKAASLVQLVRDQLAYRAIEFGRRARVPNKVPTILANRYGDCKDHSLLLAQLLQASGIDAHLALGPLGPYARRVAAVAGSVRSYDRLCAQARRGPIL